MRVALLANYPVEHDRTYGGVQAVAYHLAHGLAHVPELEVHVVHCGSDVPADRTVQEGALTVHHLWRPRRRMVPNLISGLGPLVRMLGEIRPDVANAHTGQYAFAALQVGIPTVYTIHGVPRRELRAASGVVHALALAVAAAYDRAVARRVDDVVAISPFIEHEYRHRTRARFHRAENPVCDELFRVGRDTVPGRILFAGTVCRNKRPALLLEALDTVVPLAPTAHVHVAGRSPAGRYLHRLERLARDGQARGRVAILGMLDPKAMAQEYAECALLALPSAVETSPVVILEAMAAGRPVVATRVGGVPDLVEEGRTGFLVAPGDVNALSERIVRLLTHDELRARMGAHAREVARSRFQRDLVAARYREIYAEVLARRQHSRGETGP